MFTSMSIASTVVAGLLYGASVPAVVPTVTSSSVVPSNVRVVQKSDVVAGGRAYLTIQAAIDSIGNASAGNPYVVRVMPGIYWEAVRMKPFVSVVGSGADNTVIQGSMSSSLGECDSAVVMMASDSTLSDLRVVNTTPAYGNILKVIGIAFDGIGTARASRIEVWAGSDTRVAQSSIAICANGPNTHAVLDQIDVEGHGGVSGRGGALHVAGGASLAVSDSRLAAFAVADSVNVIGDGGSSADSAVITNCTVEGTARHVYAIRTYSGRTVVTNSRIVLNGSEGNSFIAVDEPDEDFTPSFTMQGSTVTVNGPSGNLYSSGNVYIATSRLPGDRAGFGPNAKLVLNYDENANPIPNQ